MNRLPLLILVFSFLFAFFFITPALLDQQFVPFPLVKVGDIVDLATPLILLPLYWLLYRYAREDKPGLQASLIFVALAALWAEGHGIHLAANSIGHLLGDQKASDAYALTHFFDENLSHVLLHSGVIALSGILLLRQWPGLVPEERLPLWSAILAALLYGFTYFLIIVEGGTAVIGIPFALLVVVAGLIWGRTRIGRQPLTTFFVLSYGLAILLFAIWAIRWGGLPEFSEVGIIS